MSKLHKTWVEDFGLRDTRPGTMPVLVYTGDCGKLPTEPVAKTAAYMVLKDAVEAIGGKGFKSEHIQVQNTSDGYRLCVMGAILCYVEAE